MNGLDDLQKALDFFIKQYNDYLDLTEKILPGQPEEVRDFVGSMLESLRLENLFLNRMKDDLSGFVGEQAAKQQALRKLVQNRPTYSITCENWHNSNNEHISDELVEDWLIHFEKVFDEVFGKTEGNK